MTLLRRPDDACSKSLSMLASYIFSQYESYTDFDIKLDGFIGVNIIVNMIVDVITE